ncbi:MAG: sugar ABC transporter permease [Clostridia bacterium]|nr:sugar ABC transporter permease [Clostridia bacterium]
MTDVARASKRNYRRQRRLRELPLHLMLLPGLALILVFHYIPMLGIVMAFQNFKPAKGILGSKWVGMDNFVYMAKLPNMGSVLFNTVFIAVLKIILGMIVPIFVALMLNEVGNKGFKRTVQTVVYFPHFLSWVILGGVLMDVLSPSSGIVNDIIRLFGGTPIYFLGDKTWFPYTMVITAVWKNFGYDTIVYLAALTNVDRNLYEAAAIDGATRMKQTWHVTLPGILPIVTLMGVLNLGNILNAGFDQIFNLYSPSVYSTGDIIDTFVYRLGLEQAQFSVSTAVGLFKSVISIIMVSLSNYLAGRFANYRVF